MDWRERIRAARDRIFGGRKNSDFVDPGQDNSAISTPKSPLPPLAAELVSTNGQRSSNGQQSLSTVAINLGIDFGTSFTKVCYRDVGTEESGVVAVGHEFKKALVPSVVAVSASGHLCLGDGVANLSSPVSITYLKMRLAGAPIGDSLPEIAGIDLNKPDSIKALSAWFLSSVIVRSQEWMGLHQADRLKNRNVVWSANVGVPVEHFDSDALETFKQVLGVAWLWVKTARIPATIQDAVEAYGLTAVRLESEVIDFHAIPEIAAAVQSFVMSREAIPGIYVYFDIGGGTVDGVAFDFANHQGERRINFYSGKVVPLGISAIGSALKESAEEIDAVKLETLLKECLKTTRDDFTVRLRRLVAEVVMTAKRKDGRNWQQNAIQNSTYERKYLGRLSPKHMRPLIVFLGGGGSKSSWYTSTISSTYTEFNHHKAGVPPYKLLQVPRPADFTMLKPDEKDFTRFAISYGLSIPFGEGPEIRLPSQFGDAEKPRQWSPPGMIDYADSKDVYD